MSSMSFSQSVAGWLAIFLLQRRSPRLGSWLFFKQNNKYFKCFLNYVLPLHPVLDGRITQSCKTIEPTNHYWVTAFYFLVLYYSSLLGENFYSTLPPKKFVQTVNL